MTNSRYTLENIRCDFHVLGTKSTARTLPTVARVVDFHIGRMNYGDVIEFKAISSYGDEVQFKLEMDENGRVHQSFTEI